MIQEIMRLTEDGGISELVNTVKHCGGGSHEAFLTVMGDADASDNLNICRLKVNSRIYFSRRSSIHQRLEEVLQNEYTLDK